MSKWDEILNTLESGYDLSHILINTWIKPLTIYKVEGKTVYFVVDEKFGQRGVDFIKNRSYDILLASAIREVLNDSSVEVIVTLASDFNTDKSQAAPALRTIQ